METFMERFLGFMETLSEIHGNTFRVYGNIIKQLLLRTVKSPLDLNAHALRLDLRTDQYFENWTIRCAKPRGRSIHAASSRNLFAI